MNMEMNKLLGFIKENSKDGEIQLYPPELLALGIDGLKAERMIDELSKLKAILQKRIAFAPNKVQSTIPKQADFSSVANNTYSIPVFLLRVDEERVQEVLGENLKSSFDDNGAEIRIGGQIISLPPSTNEHCLCRVMFKRSTNEFIDWSEIYEEMTGDNVFKDTNKTKMKWRMVYDAMEAVNGKVKEQTNSPLFEWREKMIRRLY